MKKLLISIGSILILSFVVVLFINAADSDKNPKKAKTEAKKEAVTPSCQTSCAHAGDKTTPCDPEKCKEQNCVQKDGKCDPESCAAHKEEGKTSCLQTTAGCKGTCHTSEK